MANCTRILQLSDIHLFGDITQTLLGINTYNNLQLILNEIAHDSFKPDIIVLTGDLSQDNSKESYEILVNELSTLPCSIYWVPGNHDDPALMQQLFAGKFLAEKNFMIPEKWRVILLNSAQPKQVPGFLNEEELKRLSLALQNPEHLYSVIFLHHHPLPVGSAWLDVLGLTNNEKFLEIIKNDQRCRAVIYGHVHQVYEKEHHGVQFNSAPAVAIQFLPESHDFALDTVHAPGYRCIELWDNGELKTWVRRLKNYKNTYDTHAKGY